MTTGRPEPGGAGGEEPTRADPLSTDRLLRACVRAPWEALQRPVLGRILITAPVGKGGMGAVYRGIHRTLGQERAVKVLLASADDALRERFLREARFAAQIDSPHLVRVHDADEDAASGLVYLEMEYVRGISAAMWMREAVQSGRVGVPEDDALVVCLAACRGLEAAHAAGVVHRDLKPGNILIPEGAGGRPNLAASKVADLGLARSEEADASLTATNTFVGTPGFAAPEQIADAKRAGKPADVFSMGATLYALLSGRSPFDGTSSSDTIVRTTLGRRTPLPELRRGLSAGTLAIVDRCLSMDPADRYADATALREAIESRLSGAEPPTTVGAPWAHGPSEESTVGSPVPTPRPRHVPPTPLPAAPTAADPVAVPASRSEAPKTPEPAEAPAVAGPPTPAAGSSAPAAPAPPARSAGRKVAAWIGVGVVVAGLGKSLLVLGKNWREQPTGPQDGAPAAQHPVDPEAGPGAGGTSPGAAAAGRVHLQYCPPGARVFLGDREVREGDRIPRGPGRVRVTLERHADQEVEYGANDEGEIWIRPPEFRPNRGSIVLITKYEGVQAFRDGKPVSGRIDVTPDEDHKFEFRRRGFDTQFETGRVEPGGSVEVTPPNYWSWTGALSIELAPGAKLRYELTERAEGDGAPDRVARPGGVEWEVERLAGPEPQLRLKVTRIRGRAEPETGEPFLFDSSDEGWATLVAAHRDDIAAAAPLALLEAGPIDVAFDADGAPRTWKPFAASVRGLPGVATGKDDQGQDEQGKEEKVQRSVIAFLVLRPDLGGTTPLGNFSFHESTPTTSGLSAYRRDRGAEVRSKLTIAMTDGLGESLDIETKRGSAIVRTSVKRR